MAQTAESGVVGLDGVQQMPPRKPRQFSLALLCLALVVISVILAAYADGNWLLGVHGGLIYATVAALACWLLVRAITTERLRRFRIGWLLILSIPLVAALVNPALLDSRMQQELNLEARQRSARAELRTTFASDGAFAGLRFETSNMMGPRIQITGTVPTHDDLIRVQHLVERRRFAICQYYIEWQVDVQEDSKGPQH